MQHDNPAKMEDTHNTPAVMLRSNLTEQEAELIHGYFDAKDKRDKEDEAAAIARVRGDLSLIWYHDFRAAEFSNEMQRIEDLLNSGEYAEHPEQR